MVIVKFCLGCLVCPAIPGARQRDTSRQWDNSDELFFCGVSLEDVADYDVYFCSGEFLLGKLGFASDG